MKIEDRRVTHVALAQLILATGLTAFAIFPQATASAAPIQLFAGSITRSNDWVNESYAEGAPEWRNQDSHTYSTNSVQNSGDYLTVTSWAGNLTVPAGRLIDRVYLNAVVRFDAGSSDNSIGLRVGGSVPRTTVRSPTWSQRSDDDALRYAFPDGWDITELRAYWDEGAIRNLDAGVRRYSNQDTRGSSVCRVDAIVLTVTFKAAEAPPRCSITPATVNFGTVSIGDMAEAQLTIRNAGGSILSGTSLFDCGATAFSLDVDGPFSLAADEELVITVYFAPEEPGDYSCALGNGPGCPAVMLAGRAEAPAEPGCALSTSILEFGDVPVGETHQLNLTLTSTGHSDLVGEVQTVGCEDGPFSIVAGAGPFTLAPGQNRTIVVAFAPADTGLTECELTFGDTCADAVALSGIGTGFVSCTTSKDSLEFDLPAANAMAEQTIEISNVGTLPTEGEVSLACEAGPFALVEGAGEYRLDPGQTRRITISFSPTEAGESECTLETGGCGEIELQGHAGPFLPECVRLEGPLEPVEVAAADTAFIEIAVINPGGGDLVGELRIEPPDIGFSFPEPPKYDLAPGDSAFVILQFTAPTVGEYAAFVISGDCDSIEVRSSAVAPVIPAGGCVADPDTVDFGIVPPGQSVEKTLVIKNRGLELVELWPEMDCPEGLFAVEPPDFNQVLAPGDSTLFTVSFQGDDGDSDTCLVETGCGAVLLMGRAGAITALACPLTLEAPTMPVATVGMPVTLTLTARNHDSEPRLGQLNLTELSGRCRWRFVHGAAVNLDANSSRPVEVEAIPLEPGECRCRAIVSGCDNPAYLGVEAVRAPEIAGTPRVRLSRNPFREEVEFQVWQDAPGPIRITILDASGRLVRALTEGFLPMGEQRLSWDGRDQLGRRTPSGQFVAVVESAEGRSLVRLTRIH